MKQPETIFLSDYKSPDYRIETCELFFDIFEDKCIVSNTMQILKCGPTDTPLLLNGEHLQLDSVHVDGSVVHAGDYEVDDSSLRLFALPERCSVTIVTTIFPQLNTALEGLYKSGSIFCTQNEPEGFRRITYFIDRPDNMSVFTSTVSADKSLYPVLLSNGNLSDEGESEGGRHWVRWHDPFAKPAYLFALVAGDLGVISDTFTTMSGRNVALNIYCDKGNERKCYHAMHSLQRSMKWDEERYGREYDLEIYNIVAVDSFNMGAMENKGLNIFNSHYVLADEDTATDNDFMGIESVIAHEYFHNWTGNRITCRDWFQLTLKEGLTVFRDQCFSAEMNSETVQRISDVKALRERQFVEDAGPTAHPIKPDSYIEINNFYTATVYEKGAEVIRMIHTLLGPERFRAGMDLYFKTFDGQAVRTEDFLWAMEEGGGADLTQFERWYSQERTPKLEVSERYDAAAQTLELTLKQVVPSNVDGAQQQPYAYPLGFAMLDHTGRKIEPELQNASNQPLLERGMLWVSHAQEHFVFEGVPVRPRLSLNRHFSAPVTIYYAQADYPFLMRYDDDGFNRYEAAQAFALQTLNEMLHGHAVNAHYVEAFGMILEDTAIDLQFKSQLLELPSVSVMMQGRDTIDFPELCRTREALINTLASRYEQQWLHLYEAHHDGGGGADAQSIGKRALKNRALAYLMRLGRSDITQCCEAQYRHSVTMTDRICALDLLENHAAEAAYGVLADFYARYANDTLVMNKYFSIIAASQREGTLDRVEAMQSDKAFSIQVPNLVRSLFGVFARNHLHFHAHTGYGYAFIAEKVIELDAINPQIASGLAGAFKSYERLCEPNKTLMRLQLEKMLAHDGLSNNVYEIVEKILHGARKQPV